MVKFAICNETYQNWPLQRVCQHVAECGYDGLEVAPFTLHEDPRELTERDAAAAGGVVRAAGLSVVGFHWLLVTPAGLCLTSSDDELHRRTVDFAVHLTRLCAAMGGTIMVWGSPKQRGVAQGQTYHEAFGRAQDALRQVAEIAGPLGVTIALEPLTPAETNFLTSADETERLIRAIDHPACRLHLDVKAMSAEGPAIPEIIRRHGEYLVHFHANDANRRGPGFGAIDYGPIAAALAEIGYQRYVSVEVFDYTPDPETIARQSLAYLKRHFAGRDAAQRPKFQECP